MYDSTLRVHDPANSMKPFTLKTCQVRVYFLSTNWFFAQVHDLNNDVAGVVKHVGYFWTLTNRHKDTHIFINHLLSMCIHVTVGHAIDKILH